MFCLILSITFILFFSLINFECFRGTRMLMSLGGPPPPEKTLLPEKRLCPGHIDYSSKLAYPSLINYRPL